MPSGVSRFFMPSGFKDFRLTAAAEHLAAWASCSLLPSFAGLARRVSQVRECCLIVKERDEPEPYSRLDGELLKDAIDEAGIKNATEPEKVIMVTYPSCEGLSQEFAVACRRSPSRR